MQDSPYLTSEEAAAYLRIKERKLYELAAKGEAPCAKVTGKWLFPRSALDRWIEAGMATLAVPSLKPAPPIVGGSHDPLLEWALRRSGSGLALLAEGSEAGLERLAANSVCIAATHLHDLHDDTRANEEAVGSRADLFDAVVIAFVSREQGLIVGKGNPTGLLSVRDAIRKRVRFGMRQAGAGAQKLLEKMLAQAEANISDLLTSAHEFNTGQDLAQAIRTGEIDCGLATRAVASGLGLDFVSLEWERFDLVLRRRTYFEDAPQLLFSFMKTEEFSRQATSLGGYDLADTGKVRLNR